MPRALKFQLGEDEIALEMNKVDRSRLYGSKEQLVLDEDENPCDLATLADDGRTLIGKGGTALGWLDADGRWCDKSELTPINVDGDEVEPVKSSFGETIRLFETIEVEEYLNHNVRLLYELRPSDPSQEDSVVLQQLKSELAKGTIFQFEYSFRGGLQADAAFLLANEDNCVMMAVGTRANVAMIGLAAPVTPEADVSTDSSDNDSFDFEMI
ncbi:MAG TPA: hypothetical protein DDW52_24025 [Planctomycetaceae bacterium]|nr:hypothetical protein [Planctomycetaceae bacterium]